MLTFKQFLNELAREDATISPMEVEEMRQRFGDKVLQMGHRNEDGSMDVPVDCIVEAARSLEAHTLTEAAGVRPDAVVGHSQGEIAAACVAGILSLPDAAKVVALRSRALTALAGQGGMVSVAEPAARVRERLARWGDRLSVAAVNGPVATVVSGEPVALEELAAACAGDGVRVKVLPVDYASHSAQVEGIRPEIVAVLAGIAPGQARVPMVSAMSGEWLTGPEAVPGYWFDSLRAPVEFDRAVRVLAGSGHGVFVERSE